MESSVILFAKADILLYFNGFITYCETISDNLIADYDEFQYQYVHIRIHFHDKHTNIDAITEDEIQYSCNKYMLYFNIL